MLGQVPEKKKIDWGFWGTIILAIIGVSLFVSGLVWILTTSRSDFENFGNTAGTRLEDILKWGTVNSNNGYKITGRVSNVRRYDLAQGKNKYFLYPGTYQYLTLTKIKNPSSSNSIIYFIPMNVSGKDANNSEFTANKAFLETHKYYPSFDLNRNISLIPAHTKNHSKRSYFYIENMNNIENVNITLGDPNTIYDSKYSPWFCRNNKLQQTYYMNRIPQGYKFGGFRSRNLQQLRKLGEKYPLNCPDIDGISSFNSRRSAIYIKKL